MCLAKQRHKHRQVNQRKNATDVAPFMIMGNAQHLVKNVLNVDYKATLGYADDLILKGPKLVIP